MEECWTMCRVTTKIVLDKLNKVLSKKKRPEKLVGSNELTDDEMQEAFFFADKNKEELSCNDIEQRYEAVYWFSSEAFCYYLPMMLYICIKEEKVELLFYDVIIDMLDRQSNIKYWDDFFTTRWRCFSTEEIESIKLWLLWLKDKGYFRNNTTTFERSMKTLDLLKQQNRTEEQKGSNDNNNINK